MKRAVLLLLVGALPVWAADTRTDVVPLSEVCEMVRTAPELTGTTYQQTIQSRNAVQRFNKLLNGESIAVPCIVRDVYEGVSGAMARVQLHESSAHSDAIMEKPASTECLAIPLKLDPLTVNQNDIMWVVSDVKFIEETAAGQHECVLRVGDFILSFQPDGEQFIDPEFGKVTDPLKFVFAGMYLLCGALTWISCRQVLAAVLPRRWGRRHRRRKHASRPARQQNAQQSRRPSVLWVSSLVTLFLMGFLLAFFLVGKWMGLGTTLT